MRVAVIGGGVAGLSAAQALLAGGADPVVFEAAERAGGKVGSAASGGWLTEDGPHFLAKPLDTLLDFAGLRGEVVKPQPLTTRWVHLGGKVLKAPSLALLFEANAPRALLEPLFAKPLREDMPLRDLLVQRLGKSAGSLAAEVMAAGVYAGDPAQLSARDAFPTIGALAAQGSIIRGAMKKPAQPRTGLWNLRKGLGSLPDTIAAKLGGRVRLNATVTQLGPGFTVQGEKFDAVILAAPASAAATLLRSFAPQAADALLKFVSASVTLVHLGFPQAQVPRGFGMIDADAALCGIGTLFPSSMLPGRAPEGRALVSAICGGARHPERARLADDELTARVREDLRRTLGITADPEYVRIVRHDEAIPQYTVGHRERVAAVREALKGFAKLELAGAAYDGVSVPDVARSGAAAAARILA